LLDVVRQRHSLGVLELQRPRFELFVVQVQPGKLPAGVGEGAETTRGMESVPRAERDPGCRSARGTYRRGQPDARQLAFQVVGELAAVTGMVQHAVDVVEDVPLGDRLPLSTPRALLPVSASRALLPVSTPRTLLPVSTQRKQVRLVSHLLALRALR